MSNKFKSKKALRIWGISAICVAVISALLRLLSIFFFYDKDIGYYRSGAVLPIIAQALPVVFVVAAFVFAVIPYLRPSVGSPSSTFSTRIISVFPAAGFSGYAVVYLISFAEQLRIYGTSLTRDLIWNILISIAIIGAAVFFWLTFLNKKIGTILYSLMGLCVILTSVYFLAGSYFDTFVQMNAPNKTVFQFALLTAMLLTVNEMRVGLSENKPVFHLFTATAAVIFMTTSALPSIICCFAGKMPLNYTVLFEDGVILLFAVFAFARLCSLCFCKEITKDEATEDIQE